MVYGALPLCLSWAVLKAIPQHTPLPPLGQIWPGLTASTSLAVVAGFVSPLPAGLGVRDLVLNELMVEPFGRPVALVSTVLLRLVWLLTEVLVSTILYLWLKSVPAMIPRKLADAVDCDSGPE